MSTSLGGSTYGSAVCTHIVQSSPLSLSVPPAFRNASQIFRPPLQGILFVAYYVTFLLSNQ